MPLICVAISSEIDSSSCLIYLIWVSPWYPWYPFICCDVVVVTQDFSISDCCFFRFCFSSGSTLTLPYCCFSSCVLVKINSCFYPVLGLVHVGCVWNSEGRPGRFRSITILINDEQKNFTLEEFIIASGLMRNQ